jgi:hypothetical protein
MPSDPSPVSVFDIVRRSVDAVDPDRADALLGDLLERFEDDDEPIGPDTAEVAAQTIAEEAGALDPQAEDPAVQLAAAVATYLAFRRDEVDEDPGALLELAARAEFGGHPPAEVGELLAQRGVEL